MYSFQNDREIYLRLKLPGSNIYSMQECFTKGKKKKESSVVQLFYFLML